MYTSDNMETQADLGETSTLYLDISLAVFGEWHLLCFLHSYITSGGKAVNHGKKVNLEHAARADWAEAEGRRAFYTGLTVTALWGRWQAATTASPRVLQLCDVIYLWNSSEQQHGPYDASVRENATVEMCTREKTVWRIRRHIISIFHSSNDSLKRLHCT